jgi:hypothetical protein
MKPAFVPVTIVGGTALSYLTAAIVGVPALVPLFNVVPAFPFMIVSLRRGRVAEAVIRMLIWAAALGICGTVISYRWTSEAGTLFLHGEEYRREMFAFLITGIGAEGDIRQFLPMHAVHATVFSLLALATGSLLAMPAGAALMNYMAYYVGALAATSIHPVRVIAVAWVPWALLRIASFVTLGVVLSGPILGRLLGFEYRLRDQARWIGAALTGLVLDVVLKWGFAPAWREFIRTAAGW